MSRQLKGPTIADDLRMLGDIYLSLAWLAVQRVRYGSRWPQEARKRSRGPIVTLVRPRSEDEADEAVASRRG